MRTKLAITLLLCFELILLSTASLPAVAQETAGNKYAVLVGVRDYDRNQLRNLSYTENDVTELADLLRQSGFRRVELLTQAEGAKKSRALPMARTIRESIQGMLEDRRKDDLVVIAFAGHGVQFKGEAENYFCPMDAVLTDRSTLVSLTGVYEQLKQSKAGSKLLLVDACRNDPLSGVARAAADVVLQSETRPQIPDPPGGVAALFSCSAGQKAFEDDMLKHGIFFHHVIQGLKGQAKLQKRDEVTWDSLVSYVKTEVPDTVKDLIGNQTRQIPEHRGELRGEATLITFKNFQPVKDETGFVSLFDGETLEGWAGVVEDYEVVNGAIRSKPQKRSVLHTQEMYDDFVVRLEFKLTSGANSGLAIRYSGQGIASHDGMCEIQIQDDDAEKYRNQDSRQYNGSAFGKVAAIKGSLKPVGEWNYQETTVIGSTVKVELNGNVILNTDLKKVTSFMNNKPHPGKDRTTGYFGFTGWDDTVEFRNIRIKRLASGQK